MVWPDNRDPVKPPTVRVLNALKRPRVAGVERSETLEERRSTFARAEVAGAIHAIRRPPGASHSLQPRPPLARAVRFEVVKEAGWLCPVLAQADWPLGQLTADPAGLSLAPSILGDEAFSVRIAWSAVRLFQRTLTGLRIQFVQGEDLLDATVHGPFLWSRLHAAGVLPAGLVAESRFAAVAAVGNRLR